MTLPVKQADSEIAAFRPIRVESLLSRYPIHRLSNRGNANITIKDKKSDELVWEVTHNSKYGEPGPLAYKIETLVINRRIDEARCPNVPEIIRLGSMREIAELCGLGADTNLVKKALHQNASAYITATLSHTDRDQVVRTFEISGSRFGIVFTGEHFPNGKKADAVYLVLNSWYREMQNTIPTRPLDYDYLKDLPPAAQRLYELLSYQIYAALKHNRPRARILYSEFCQMAPQTRYLQFKRMHRQMKDIHQSHIDSGYFEKDIEFHETKDQNGDPDWEIFYIPGPKARFEHNLATKKKERLPSRQPPQLSLTLSAPALKPAPIPVLKAAPPPAPQAAPPPQAVLPPDPETLALIEQLTARGLGRRAAEEYAREKPDECRRQLDHLGYVTEFKSTQGAYLRSAIEHAYGPPKGYDEAKKAEAAQAQAEARAAALRARKAHEEAYQSSYTTYLSECLAQLEATAPEACREFLAEEKKMRAWHSCGPFSKKEISIKAAALYDAPETRRNRFRAYVEKQAQQRKPFPGVLSFWNWDKELNPERFGG
jgi:hypothetical protein